MDRRNVRRLQWNKKQAPEHTDSGDEVDDPLEADEGGEEEETQVHNPTKGQLLLEQVTVLSAGKGKNPGGLKGWQCKHCKKKFSSSLTRIQMHFFGAGPGKTAQIKRCQSYYKMIVPSLKNYMRRYVYLSLIFNIRLPLRIDSGLVIIYFV